MNILLHFRFSEASESTLANNQDVVTKSKRKITQNRYLSLSTLYFVKRFPYFEIQTGTV